MKRWWGRSSRQREGASRRSRDDLYRQTQSVNNQFLRSRTISAYTPVAPDLSRLSAHELHSHRQKLLRILCGLVLAIALLGFILSQLTAGIGTISYTPAVVSNPDATAIKSAVNDYYSSRPLERLRFLLNEKTLGQFLVNKIPEIQGVESVGADGLGASRLALALRTPVASWNVGGKTVYVDSNGESFTHNYYAAPGVTVDDQSGATVNGSAVASTSMIRYIGQLIAALQGNGTGTVNRVVLPAGMIRELDVYLQGRGYRIKVQLDRDVASQAEDARAAVTYINAHGGASEYIDVRVAGKAFYK